MLSHNLPLRPRDPNPEARHPSTQNLSSIAPSTFVKEGMILEATPVDYSRMTEIRRHSVALPKPTSLPSKDHDLLSSLTNLFLKPRLPPGCSLTPERLLNAETEVARQYVPGDYSPILPVPPAVTQKRGGSVAQSIKGGIGKARGGKRRRIERRRVQTGMYSRERDEIRKDTGIKVMMERTKGLKVKRAMASLGR